MIALNHGLYIKLVEMAVISDKRRQPKSKISSFTSFVTVFMNKESAAKIHTIYPKAMERKEVRGAENIIDRIVIHNDLFHDDTGYLHTFFDGEHAGRPRTDEDEGILFSYGWQKDKPIIKGTSLEKQVEDFVWVLQDEGRAVGVGHELAG